MRPPRTRKARDIVLTVVELLILVGLTRMATVFGLLMTFQVTGCRSTYVCNDGFIAVGAFVAQYGVWAAPIAAVVISVVFLARKRRMFLVPILGLGLIIVISLIGYAIFEMGFAPIN